MMMLYDERVKARKRTEEELEALFDKYLPTHEATRAKNLLDLFSDLVYEAGQDSVIMNS